MGTGEEGEEGGADGGAEGGAVGGIFDDGAELRCVSKGVSREVDLEVRARMGEEDCYTDQ